MSSLMKKTFMGTPLIYHLQNDMKKEKNNAGQGEDYCTRCFLDYEYIKNNCKLIAVDLN